jgi:hypothetical protein
MNRLTVLLYLSVVFAALGIMPCAEGADWSKKQAPIMTRFAADVGPDNVWPEYPRPQMTRQDWQNLNGVWEFQVGADGDATPIGQTLSRSILVPFCVESALSGVMEHHDRLWYRRTFEVPSGWRDRQLILHFGAVDYETEVFVNGKSAGTHKGGYDPFSFNITPLLTDSGPQELIVKVFDPTDDGGQPRGKQSLHPGGIMYTCCSGIWQTVWLEPVAVGGIEDLKITPDVDGSTVRVTVNCLGEIGNSEVAVSVKDGNTVISSAKGKPGQLLSIPVPDSKLWSPDSPFLYNLSIKIVQGDRTIDEVGSYFGMRKIEIGDAGDGVKRMLLNGKFVFELGPLDQGFWPDGIYTPPSEAALKNDIQTIKALGFNMIRKHIKVEPARWYYWTDHLGLLVWQDMPSPNSYTEHTPPVDKPEFESELTRMVHNLQNVPSIIMWDIFNEGQGQHDTQKYVTIVKRMDPTRLVNQASGGDYKEVGDVYDLHSYPSPNAPAPSDYQALVCGEYGGIAFRVPGHMWRATGGGYIDVPDPGDLVDLYSEFTYRLKDLRDHHGLSAAVYTQITDVETEVNGLLTYDRVPKMDIATIAKANHFEIPPVVYTPVINTSETDEQDWRYTTDRPANDNWMKKNFDDRAWAEGKGGFGSPGTPNIGQLGTEWRSDDIWIRRTFNPGPLTPDQIKALRLRVYHDEDVEVYINGILAYHAGGFNGRYENMKMTPEGLRAIVPNAENVLAVHCHQTVGGQYVDVGIVRRESSPTTP